MKKLAIYSLVLVGSMAVLSSCSCTKKLSKKVDEITVSCNPKILQLTGNVVPATVTVNIPANTIKSKALIKVTPILVYETGTTEGAPFYFQGEKVLENYPVISFEEGGTISKSFVIPYTDAAKLSTLELKVEGRCKSDNIFTEVATLTVAEGVSTLGQLDAGVVSDMVYAADNYQKVKTYSQKADIHYDINSSKVKVNELSNSQIDELEKFIQDNLGNSRATLSAIQANGYASPEGPVDLNNKLSGERSKSGEAALRDKFGSSFRANYDTKSYGEDWDGFRELVEASNIKDKDLILSVLSMYSSSTKRDQEIKNMTSVFEVLKDEILPELRRTQFVVNSDVEMPSDSEVLAMALKGDSSLTVDDLLYAATLTKDLNEKVQIYKQAAKLNDARAYNNLAVAQAQLGDLVAAAASLKQAATLQSTPNTTNNMAIVSLAQGNLSQARQYLSSLGSNASKDAQGLIAMAEGDFASASSQLSGYYKAVADACNNNLAAAKAAVANDDSAKADYLKAVIAAKEGNDAQAISYLKSAVAKDSSLRDAARKDINFSSLFSTSEFRAL